MIKEKMKKKLYNKHIRIAMNTENFEKSKKHFLRAFHYASAEKREFILKSLRTFKEENES